jgi:hypothetical protein
MASPDPGPDASQSAAPPDWYSHGLNRLFYYRIARAAASTLPRPARLGLARGNFFDAWSPPHGHA